MQKLDRSKLWSLEEYAQKRDAFRAEVIEHKKPRRVALTPNATMYFEDFTTLKYQVQEMLRVERLFEAADIEDELAAYNPLIPDGTNWKGTFMFEYPDVEERRRALGRMAGIEHRIWVQVAGQNKVFAVANEDLDRSTDEKTSAVHFLRFELDPKSIEAAKAGADIKMGIDHDEMRCEVTLSDDTRKSLVGDLD
tara:strand:- start:230 stop:811 length:582 start_codon:yes stop_codon:yes gene_type:complete